MFSKQVILDVIKSLPNKYAFLEEFLIRFDLDNKIDTTGLKTAQIKLAITRYLIVNQNEKDQLGNNILLKIIEERLNNYLIPYKYDEYECSFSSYPELYSYLRYDGYDIQNGKLVRTLPSNIGSSEKESQITALLIKYGFITTKGHLDSAKSSYSNSNYPSLTAQLRTYVESLFMDMAKHIKNKDTFCVEIQNISPTNAIRAMQVLAKCSNPIILKELNEWDGGGKQTFIEGFWKTLHTLGSHPGIPDTDEALFRFQLVLLVTYNLLKRFEKFYE